MVSLFVGQPFTIRTYSNTCVEHYILLGMALIGKESLLASSKTSDGETTSCRIFSTQIVHKIIGKIHGFMAVKHEVPIIFT